MNARITRTRWVEVCALDDIGAGGSLPALVGRLQLALHRVADSDAVYASDAFDPFSKAYVLSRGLVGDRGGVVKVASPLHKQSFALATGECLDDPAVRVPIYGVRVRGGIVELSA